MPSRLDEMIALRIPSALKRQLFEYCRENGVTLAQWFRQQAQRTVDGTEKVAAAPAHRYSAFVSHAHEDKETFVRPLALALTTLGHTIWYDEFELQVGDSLRKSIDQGLRSSAYGIVVFSKAFFEKNWPQYELNGLLTREIDGKKIILPVWHGVSRDDVLKYSASMVDKVALRSDTMPLTDIANALSRVIGDTPRT